MVGYADTKPLLQKRLRRIEGQIRGLQRLIDEDTYCIDVLTQITAATKALESVAHELLDGYVQHCVHDAISSGGAEMEQELSEATAAIRRLVRS